MNLKKLRGLFSKKAEPKHEPVAKAEREHRGQGARKAARRKFRHALQNKFVADVRNEMPGISPAQARFHARVRADRTIAEGTTEPNAHGRGLMRA